MRLRSTTSRGRGALVAVLLLATASAPSLAQEPTEPEPGQEAAPPAPEELPPQTPAPAPAYGDVEVITIRGQHHDDLLQDTSISVTSFDTKELDDLRIQNIADLAEYTPNLDINTRSAASNPTLFIRGIGLKDYNANAAGAVAVYQDGININAPAIQLFQLFDVASVEVLRGPQGTGSGRNASAGAIKVNSVQPDGLFGGTASFTYGNYNTIQAEGALNLPLVEDMLSARFAFTANFRDGITENACARWNPQAEGFLKVTEETIRTTYQDLLNPSATRVNSIRFGAGAINNQGPSAPRFIYEPEESAARGWLEGNGITSWTTTVGTNQPTEVALPDATQDQVFEKFLSENGIRPGRRVNGRVVGLQTDSFEQPPDGVCVVQAPGFIPTPLGADSRDQTGAIRMPQGLPPGTPPFPADQVGSFRARNVPSLEDFQGLKERINNVDDWAGRGILRFQPFDDMEWLLNAHGGRNRSDSRHLQMIGANILGNGFLYQSDQNGFSEANAARATGKEGLTEVDGLALASNNPAPGGVTGSDPYTGWYNRDGNEDLDAWGTSLRGSWDLGPVLLTSVGGYEWYDRVIEDEGDANPLDVFRADYSDSAWQVSEELRAQGEGERHRWNVGLNFLTESLEAANIFPDTRNFRIEQRFDQKLWSLAPYVGGRYDFTEELSVESGVRYNVEHKDFTLASDSVGTVSGISVAAIEEEQQKKTWTGVTGDVTFGYTPYWSALDRIQNDNLNFYAKYARGMKAGHFNAGLTITGTEQGTEARIDPVEPEFIHAAEVGWKSGWLDNRLVVNVSAFRYWYKDLQVFDITNEIGELPLQRLLNSDARVWGAEVELQARPLPGLSIQGGFGWLSGHFKDFVVRKAINAPRGQGELTPFDYDGNPLIAAPKYSVSAIVDYEIPLGSLGSLIPGYDFSWRSKVYLDPQSIDPISQPPYWIHNARLAYRTPDGRIEIAGWVENFTDQYYKEDVFDLTRDFDTILEVWGDPRTYGVTVTYTW